jgi:isoleucyl-tRNA synthetase
MSKEILARVVEAYRKIRNTLRYLVANLYDFDPVVDRLPVSRLEEVDRFILGSYARMAKRVLQGYDAYDYPTIFQAVNSFTTLDLSALYSDISKDRLYTFAGRSPHRRSAQTALFVMAEGLTRLMAPILAMTSDELWRHLPGDRPESVHLAVFPTPDELEALIDEPLMQRWSTLIALRERVLGQIEPLRKNKEIGSSLQAKVILSASSAELAALEPYASHLPMLFIVSEVELRPAPADVEAHAEAMPRITIERAGGVKCERCWRYVTTVSSEPEWAGICARCQDALAEPIHG